MHIHKTEEKEHNHLLWQVTAVEFYIWMQNSASDEEKTTFAQRATKIRLRQTKKKHQLGRKGFLGLDETEAAGEV